MGDKGLFGLINAYSDIFKQNTQFLSNNNIKDGMILDISQNFIRDNSFIAFTNLTVKVPFIHTLNI